MKKARKITIEKLAEMSQGEFTTIRSEMHEGFKGLKEDNRILRNDMDAGFHELSSGMKIIISELREVRKDIIETHDLRSRVERLEKKVGLASR